MFNLREQIFSSRFGLNTNKSVHIYLYIDI